MWTRYDLDAKRYRCSNSKGTLWGDVVKRITLDLEQNRIIQEKGITPNMTVHQLHDKLPEGVRSIETTWSTANSPITQILGYLLNHHRIQARPAQVPNRSRVFGV